MALTSEETPPLLRNLNVKSPPTEIKSMPSIPKLDLDKVQNTLGYDKILKTKLPSPSMVLVEEEEKVLSFGNLSENENE